MRKRTVIPFIVMCIGVFTLTGGTAWGLAMPSGNVNVTGVDGGSTWPSFNDPITDDFLFQGNSAAWPVRLVLDLGQSQDISAVLIRNTSHYATNSVVYSANCYVAADESVPGFVWNSAGSYGVLAGAGPLPRVNTSGTWRVCTFGTTVNRRYVLFNAWSILSGGNPPFFYGDFDVVSTAYQEFDVSAGTIAELKGDYLNKNTVGGESHFTAVDVDGDGSIFIKVDLGQAQVIDELMLTNRFFKDTDNSPLGVRMWVAPDESAAGFDPCNATDYSQQVASTYFDFSSSTAGDKRLARIASNPTRRYVLLEVYSNRTGALSGSNNCIEFADLSLPQYNATGGRLISMGADRVTVNPIEMGDPNRMFNVRNFGGDIEAIEFVLDMGESKLVDSVWLRNWNAGATNYNIKTMAVYAADESDPGFYPYVTDDYTTQIGQGIPSPSSNAANALRTLDVTNTTARYLLIKVTANFWGDVVSGTYAWLKDMGYNVERITSAGRIFGIGGDYAAVGSDSDPCYPLVTMRYNYPTPDVNSDGTIDAVIDLGSVKDIRYVSNINRYAMATNFNIRDISIFVTPAPGDPNAEDSVGFNPHGQENYTVQIFDGSMTPVSNQAGVEREADVTDVSRRYVRLSVSATLFGAIPDTSTYVQTGDFQILGTDAISSCDDVNKLGLTLVTDLNSDCYINLTDLAVIANDWLQCTHPSGQGCDLTAGSISSGTIAAVPAAGITVDGNLSDWPSDSEWLLLDEVYSGTPPFDINDARFTMRWDAATSKIYAAVVVVDQDHLLTDDFGSSYDASDRIEIYSQGDASGGTGWGSSGHYDVAQQYFVGAKLSGGAWAAWANNNTTTTPASAGLDYAAVVNGDTIAYEIAVPMYNNYGGISGGTTELTTLAEWQTVGFDIVADTRYDNGASFGMLSENMFAGKSSDAGQFQQYMLVNEVAEQFCGDWGYLPTDVSRDCYVGLADFAMLANQWLECNDPADGTCVNNW